MRTKYTRTMHHPLSGSVQSDDKVIQESHLSAAFGNLYVATEKMDGECTTIYPDGFCHARSVSSGYHPSRTWVKQFAASIGFKIPTDHRICGENVYAKHSVPYSNLSSFFLGFNIWHDDIMIPWDNTLELFKSIGISSVPVVWKGTLSPEIIEELWNQVDTEVSEGLVFRPVGSVSLSEFPEQVFKLVRPDHVQSDKHWMHQEVITNGIIN